MKSGRGIIIILFIVFFTFSFREGIAFSELSCDIAISGSDGVTKSGSYQYSIANAVGDIRWCVEGAGVSINASGVVTLNSDACGSFAVKTTDSTCGTSATQDSRVTDAGKWVEVANSNPTCDHFYMLCIENITTVKGKYRKNTGSWCDLADKGLTCIQGGACEGNCNGLHRRSNIITYEWQCVIPKEITTVCAGGCEEGQTRACGTSNVGICRTGTQTCTNGAWGACVGEVLPQVEVCDGVDNDCDGQTDEGWCDIRIPNMPVLVRQNDPQWRTKQYDYTNETIWGSGCAMASLTMAMNSKGCYVDLPTVNRCKECFNKDGWILWSIVLQKFCPSVSFEKIIVTENEELLPFQSVIDIGQMKKDIENGYLYIARVKSVKSEKCKHFVLVKGISDDCSKLEVLDPATTYTEITEMCGYRKLK